MVSDLTELSPTQRKGSWSRMAVVSYMCFLIGTVLGDLSAHRRVQSHCLIGARAMLNGRMGRGPHA